MPGGELEEQPEVPLAALPFDEMVPVFRLGEEDVPGHAAVIPSLGVEHERSAQAVVHFQATGMDVLWKVCAGQVDARPADSRHARDPVGREREEVHLVRVAERTGHFLAVASVDGTVGELWCVLHGGHYKRSAAKSP